MVNVVGFILLFISQVAFGQVVPSGVPSITLGATSITPSGTATIPQADFTSGRAFPITAGPGSANTGGNVMPFYKSDGVLYRVTAGQHSYCFGGTATAATANSLWQYMSATATFANNATTASLTGAVYQGGAAASYFQTSGPTAYLPIPALPYVFSGGVWPGIQIASSLNYMVSLMCIEGI